jgi:hypothetical protein
MKDEFLAFIRIRYGRRVNGYVAFLFVPRVRNKRMRIKKAVNPIGIGVTGVGTVTAGKTAGHGHDQAGTPRKNGTKFHFHGRLAPLAD